jgi:hypothetical protein
VNDTDADRDAIAEYCRSVEDHLTRVNAGHLVRIVGPGFEKVRRWARIGVPLSVVFRGIELKAERHQEGASRRPLRIEFCADDVEAVFEQWRRAVGVNVLPALDDPAAADDAGLDEAAEPKRPSLKRHLDRAIDRLSRALGRLDLPEPLRDACDPLLQRLVAIRDDAKGARGAARDEAEQALIACDRELGEAVAAHAAPDVVAAAGAEALADLQPFRGRLDPADYERALRVTRDRLMRGRYGLPHLLL